MLNARKEEAFCTILREELQLATGCTEPIAVAYCAARLRQVLGEMVYNLCENAVKYNRPGGRVWVDVRQAADHVELCVKDTGIGIPAAEQGRIFERFYRVDKSHSKAVGGTGLGLSIVKHGAALHHATIHVDSEPGEGTAITLTFPAG